MGPSSCGRAGAAHRGGGQVAGVARRVIVPGPRPRPGALRIAARVQRNMQSARTDPACLRHVRRGVGTFELLLVAVLRFRTLSGVRCTKSPVNPAGRIAVDGQPV
jgi:hypothetical protein